MAFYGDTRPTAARAGGSLGDAARWLLALARTWQTRARQRREVAWLTARDLADIGVTRAQVQAELSKPFWRR